MHFEFVAESGCDVAPDERGFGKAVQEEHGAFRCRIVHDEPPQGDIATNGNGADFRLCGFRCAGACGSKCRARDCGGYEQ
ncbi:hypothetical protein D3C86_2159400 [compost metagenome]